MSNCEMATDRYSTLDEAHRKHGLRRVFCWSLLVLIAMTIVGAFFLIFHDNSSDCDTSDTVCILRHERFKLFDNTAKTASNRKNSDPADSSSRDRRKNSKPCNAANTENCQKSVNIDTTERSAGRSLKTDKSSNSASHKNDKNRRSSATEKTDEKKRSSAESSSLDTDERSSLATANQTKTDETGATELSQKGNRESEKPCKTVTGKVCQGESKTANDHVVPKKDDGISEIANNVKWRHVDHAPEVPSQDKPAADIKEIRRMDQSAAATVDTNCRSGEDGKSVCKPVDESKGKNDRVVTEIDQSRVEESVIKQAKSNTVDVQEDEVGHNNTSGATGRQQFVKGNFEHHDHDSLTKNDVPHVTERQTTVDAMHGDSGAPSIDQYSEPVGNKSGENDSNDNSLIEERSEQNEMSNEVEEQPEDVNHQLDETQDDLKGSPVTTNDDNNNTESGIAPPTDQEAVTSDTVTTNEATTGDRPTTVRDGTSIVEEKSAIDETLDEVNADTGSRDDINESTHSVVEDNNGLEDSSSSEEEEGEEEEKDEKEEKEEKEEDSADRKRVGEERESEENEKVDKRTSIDIDIEVGEESDEINDYDTDRDGLVANNVNDVIDLEVEDYDDMYFEDSTADDDRRAEQRDIIDDEDRDENWTTVEDENDTVELNADDDQLDTDSRSEQHSYHSEL